MAGFTYRLTGDADQFARSMQKAQDELKNVRNRMIDTRSEINRLQKELDEASGDFTKMGNSTQSVKDRISALRNEEKQLCSQLDQVTKDIKEVTDATERHIRETDKAGKSATGFGDQMKSTFTMIKGLILGYAGKTLFQALIGTNQEYETYMAQFTTLLGSAEKANGLVDDLFDMGAKTPFDFSSLASAEQLLLSYGLSAKEAYSSLNMLGDIAQGNAEKLQSVALAYGQMHSLGKVQLQDIKQMIGAGFNPLQQIAKQTGETMESMYDRISKGTMKVEEITGAMKYATSAGGQFYKSMEIQSQTMEGMTSTLKDDLEQLGRNVGEEAFQELKGVLKEIIDYIENIDDDTIEDLGKSVANTVSWFIKLLKWLVDMRQELTVVVGAWAGLKAGLAISGVISAAITGFTALKTTLTTVTTATKAAKVANDALKASQMATPWGAILAVIGAVVGVVASLAMTTDDATSAQEKFNQEIQESKEAYESQKKSIEETKREQLAEADVIEQLRKKYVSLSKEENKSKSQKKELKGVVEQLNEKIEGLNATTKDNTQTLKDNNKEIKENIKLLEQQAMTSAYASLQSAAALRVAEKEDAIRKKEEERNVYKGYDKRLKDDIANFNKKYAHLGWGTFEQLDNGTGPKTLNAISNIANAEKGFSEQEIATARAFVGDYEYIQDFKFGDYLDKDANISRLDSEIKVLEDELKVAKKDLRYYIKKTNKAKSKLSDLEPDDEDDDDDSDDGDGKGGKGNKNKKDKAYQSRSKELKRQLELDEISQTKYYKKMIALAKKYKGANSEEYKDAVHDLKMFRKNREEEQEKLEKERRKSAKSEIKTLKESAEAGNITAEQFLKKANKTALKYLKKDKEGREAQLKKNNKTYEKLFKAEGESKLKAITEQYKNQEITIEKYESKINKAIKKYLKKGTDEYEKAVKERDRILQEAKEEELYQMAIQDKESRQVKFEDTKKNLDNALALGYTSEEDYWKKLTEAADKYLDPWTDTWVDVMSENMSQLQSMNETLISDSISKLEEMADEATEAINAYYDAIEEREKEVDRNDRLKELMAQEAAYQNAATEEGRKKLEEIQEEIEELEKEKLEALREKEKETELAAVEAYKNGAVDGLNGLDLSNADINSMISAILNPFIAAAQKITNNYNNQTSNTTFNQNVTNNINDTTSARIFAETLASGTIRFINTK